MKEKQKDIELRAIAWGSYVSFQREKGHTYRAIAERLEKSVARIRQLDLKHQRQHARFMCLCMPLRSYLFALAEKS